MHPDFEGKIVGKVDLHNMHQFCMMNVILHCGGILRVWHCYTRLDLLRDSVFTGSIPVLCRSVMVSRHVVCLWKNTMRVCNKKHIFGTLMIVW